MKRLYPYQTRVVNELVQHYVDKRGARHYLHMATGSGKTLTVMEFLARHYLNKEKRVLWITHRWPLIKQAVRELIGQRPIYNPIEGSRSDALAYYGSGFNTRGVKDLGLRSYNDSLFDETPDLLFTSWQTLYSRLGDRRTVRFRAVKEFDPSLIVIDEAHYGKNGERERSVYDLLINAYWPNVPILGLSATPKIRGKHGWSKVKLGNIYFSRLVEEGYLARPVLIEETLPADVKIKFNPNTQWIDNEREIAEDRTRNRAIVDYYCKNKSQFGKTIIFAVNTEHADCLARHLVRRGIQAVAIHSKTFMDPSDLIDAFRRNEYRVAVAVDMMNEGIDVPDVKTLFLSRPVTSEILFAQMIGRGCRKIHGKDTFNVVDFYNLGEENKDHLVHYKDWYNTEQGESQGQRSNGDRAPSEGHVSDFEPMMRTLYYDPSTDPVNHLVLSGLKIDESQTFGIEFEFEAEGIRFSDREQWLSVARPVLDQLRKTFGPGAVASSPEYDDPKSISHSKWNLVADASCGFEIVSPILRGKGGFEAVVKALRSLRMSGLIERHKIKVSTKTGTHVHLAWKYKDPAKAREILLFMRRFEGAFHSLIAASRVFGPNGKPHPYCKTVRSAFGRSAVNALRTSNDVRQTFREYDKRYCALNLTNFDRPRSTLEIRSHSGTLNETKICLWLALWMNVHNALARIKVEGLTDSEPGLDPLLPDTSVDADIISLAQSHLDITLDGNIEMLKRLHQRRVEVMQNHAWETELGDRKISEIHRSWCSRLPREVADLNLPTIPEHVFSISEFSVENQIEIARTLIDKNGLQYADPETLRDRFQAGNLFIQLEGDKISAIAGVKSKSETLNRYADDFRFAGFRSAGHDFRLVNLKAAALNARVVERGWDMTQEPAVNPSSLFALADWVASQKVRGAVPVAFLAMADKEGFDSYRSAGWKIVGQVTSPFTENRLSLLLQSRDINAFG